MSVIMLGGEKKHTYKKEIGIYNEIHEIFI
jgi:hypothetical protein